MNEANELSVLRGQLMYHTIRAEELQRELAASNAKLEFLRDTVDGLCAELERARAERDEACVELVNERADTVSYLRAPGTSCDTNVLADTIERGEHRREERT